VISGLTVVSLATSIAKERSLLAQPVILKVRSICQNADFSGEVKATVKVAELLTLKETARFTLEI
jgi:hypothetical protein